MLVFAVVEALLTLRVDQWQLQPESLPVITFHRQLHNVTHELEYVWELITTRNSAFSTFYRRRYYRHVKIAVIVKIHPGQLSLATPL